MRPRLIAESKGAGLRNAEVVRRSMYAWVRLAVLERRGRRQRSARPAAGDIGRASPRMFGESGIVAGEMWRGCGVWNLLFVGWTRIEL
jgi:hypothetical protein